MSQTARFTPLIVVHLIALVTLCGSAAAALAAFIPLPAAIAIAVVLTVVLKYKIERACEAFMRRAWAAMVGWIVGALLVASITMALTAAVLEAKIFATPSAVRSFTVLREPMERQLQRIVNQAETAHGALVAWADDAAQKAALESSQGGSCPNRAETKGIPGPLSIWRADDSRIAQALAKDLHSVLDTARNHTQTLVSLTKPQDFKQVLDAYAAANLATDSASRLTGGGDLASGIARTLGERRISAIEYGGSQPVSCGDMARLALIERASVALNALAETKPLPRVQPAVDVSDLHDVLSRALLRSINATASLLTGGALGSFATDAAMLEALKVQGPFNAETIPMYLAGVAELAVALTTVLLMRVGRPPFDDNLVDWLRAARSNTAPPVTAKGLALGTVSRMANLFYAVPEPSKFGSQTPGPGNRGFGQIDLLDDPTCRDREAGFASALLPYHHLVAGQDYLLMPIEAGTVQPRRMAHVLGAQGPLQCLSTAVPAQAFAQHPELVAELEGAHGTRWLDMHYEVFKVTPAYAQLMRLSGLQGPGPAAGGAGPAGVPSGPGGAGLGGVPAGQGGSAMPGAEAPTGAAPSGAAFPVALGGNLAAPAAAVGS